jgi:hypothetical protein
MRLYLINPSNPLVAITKGKGSHWNRYRVWKPLSLMVLAGVISEIRRPMRSLSTAGGLLRMLLFPFSVLRQAPGPKGLKRSETESTQDRGENTVELGEAKHVIGSYKYGRKTGG